MSTTEIVDNEAVSALAATYVQWVVGANQAGQVLPKVRFADSPSRRYSLENTGNRKFLQYEEQEWGINLGWTDDASPQTERRVARWFFARRSTSSGPVQFGEHIALANGSGKSFLRYAERSRGINLEWSESPVHEWRLLGGTAGTPVSRGRPLAIYNTRNGQFFRRFDRNLGADVGWSDSKRWEDQAWDEITGALKDQIADLVKQYGDDALKAAVVAALL
jgi:hypothetical protein